MVTLLYLVGNFLSVVGITVAVFSVLMLLRRFF